MSDSRNKDLEARLAARLPDPEPDGDAALQAEIDEVRAHARDYLHLPGDAPLEEIQAAFAADLWAFWIFFFPHYRTDDEGRETEGAPFHRDFAADLQAAVQGDVKQLARACPREHAKSVFASLVTPVYATANKLRHYPIIFSDVFDVAADFLEDIRIEVETNELLRAIYPEYCEWGAEPNRRRLTFGNETWIQCAGSGKSVRGARRGKHRPDLIILDDIENDEEVENVKRRRKKLRWFNKVVKKLGRAAAIIIVGTILHADSFLANQLEGDDDVYQAVVTMPDAMELWQAWEELFHNRGLTDRKEHARVFYESRREKMEAGARVLWPGRFTLYGLMVERAEDLASFLSERQNQPFDPAASYFPEDRLIFLEKDDMPAPEDVVASIGFWDPSRGTSKSDTSALPRLDILKDGRRVVSWAVVDRIPPEEVMDIAIGQHRQRPFDLLKVEKVGLSSYDEQLRTRAEAASVRLPIEPATPVGDKNLRIRSLRPDIVSGGLQFAASLPVEAIRQLKFYPQHQNDDFPDALQQAMSAADEFTADVPAAGASIEPEPDHEWRNDVARGILGRDRIGNERPEGWGGLRDRIGAIGRAWL